jgi:tetratricopeptide (TPR) repeat protein
VRMRCRWLSIMAAPFPPAPTFGAALLLAFVAFAGARAQRPKLPDDKDPNDWQEYYDDGVTLLRSSANRAQQRFEYAAHLRPDRAEPIFGQWITFWAHDIGRFEHYLSDDERTLRDPLVIRAESLRALAFRRNPLLHQGLVVVLYDQLPGRWQDDPITRGWIFLGEAKLQLAIERFGDAIRRDPERYGYLRFERASAFVNTGHADSAATEVAALLAQLRAEDAKTLGNGYESKELLEYALGLLELQLHHTPAAREALGRATVENAAFAPAHAMLAEMALTTNDTATALLEYGLATETEPNDVVLIVGHAKALRQARRRIEAAAEFRKAIAMEPLYAEPYYLLGGTLEELGDKPGAVEAYTQFLAHATRYDPRRGSIELKLPVLKSD